MDTPKRPSRWLRYTVVSMCLSSAQPLAAQLNTATIAGRVTDKSTGRAIVGAELILMSNSRSVTTDSAGRYMFSGIPPGASQLVIRAMNFPARNVVIELEPGAELVRGFVLDSTAEARAQVLPAIGVTAIAPVFNYRLVGFDLRRQNGRGQYLTEDQIVKTGAYNLADAVKHLRGVTYECGGGRGCYIRMARAPLQCLPEYVIDDQVQNDFGPSTPIRDIIAIELYTGPAEVPGEYAGRNAGCGVVVVWTRSGPPKRPRPKTP